MATCRGGVHLGLRETGPVAEFRKPHLMTVLELFICQRTLGKKNWLPFGEAGAGERGAILYTVIESCRRRGIDPYAYLKDVLTRLPSMTNRLHKRHTRQTMAPMRGGASGDAYDSARQMFPESVYRDA